MREDEGSNRVMKRNSMDVECSVQIELGDYEKSREQNNTTHVDSDKAEQIIVFSTCGHSKHNECFQKQNESKKLAGEDDSGQTMKCEHCGSIIRESDSYYLNKTNRDLFPVDGEMTTALRLLAPTRKGLTIDRK